MPACLRYKSAVTGSRQTGRLYQSFAWGGPWEKAQRDSPPSGPLLSMRGRGGEEKKQFPHCRSALPHWGRGSGHAARPAARPGPKKEKLAEICRHLVEAHHQEAALYPHFRRRTPGGWRRSCSDQVLVELSHLIPGFILFYFFYKRSERTASQPGSQEPRPRSGRRRGSHSFSALPRQPA